MLGQLRVSGSAATDGMSPENGGGPEPTHVIVPVRRPQDEMASRVLRLGLVFVFLYAAGSSFLQPETLAGYFPSFLPHSWATELLPAFGVYEVLLAAALASGRFTYVASVLAGLTLAAITAANPDAFPVLFRNVAIMCAAIALALQTRPEPRTDAHGRATRRSRPRSVRRAPGPGLS